jgi:hypothetical protein
VPNASQALERGVQDAPGGPATHVGDKADATGVSFCGEVVKRRMQVMPLSWKGRVAMERSRLLRVT